MGRSRGPVCAVNEHLPPSRTLVSSGIHPHGQLPLVRVGVRDWGRVKRFGQLMYRPDDVHWLTKNVATECLTNFLVTQRVPVLFRQKVESIV